MPATRRIALVSVLLGFCVVFVVRADCPVGDLDADCQVTVLDLQVFAEQWLAAPISAADLDGDEEVNLDDFSLLAAQWHSSNLPLLINEFMASNGNFITDPQGEHEDWIEIYNSGDEDIDLAGMYLTDAPGNPTKWRFPSDNPSLTTVKAGSYLIIWADNDVADSGLHAGFELDADGDQIVLFDSDGLSLIDRVDYGKQTTDVSYGRYPNGSRTWSYFGSPRPWTENVDPYIGEVSDTQFSHDRGFYDEPFMLTIATETEGATIYYTVNGSDPSELVGVGRSGGIYSDPIAVNTTTCVRAIAVKAGYKPANVDTQTYIFLSDVITQSQSEAIANGYPSNWHGGYPGDYEMDHEVYNDPAYKDLMDDALLSIPTVSLVMNRGHLFSHSNDSQNGGIYIYTGHSSTGGAGWERPLSTEMFSADGSKEFQVNCGVRIQGGENRRPSKSPKHGFGLRFRAIYGPSEFEFPLFEDWPVNSFDTFQFRGFYNNSWHHSFAPSQRERAQYIRDQWMRDSLLDMGHIDAGQGFFVHLYLNGMYWGLYNLQERPIDYHYAIYNGGEEEDIDAINGGRATDGTTAAWNELRSTVRNGNWDEIVKVLDVDNFIDFTIMQYYGGNQDLKTGGNWRAAGGGPYRRLWRFYSWDGERVLERVTQTGMSETDPTGLWDYLKNIPQFRVRFGDRVHKHFFNGGALYVDPVHGQWDPDHPERNRPAGRWMKRAEEIGLAVIGESARWGDYRRDEHVWATPAYLYTKNDFWIPEKNRLLNEYFPYRSDNVLDQFKSLGLYPDVSAPVFSVDGTYQHGGYVGAGEKLSMTASGSDVYYTLDGSEPLDPNAGSGGSSGLVLAAENASKRALVPGGPVDEAWRGGSAFDDSSWTFVTGGPGGVGYERTSGYQNYISLDVEEEMYGKVASCYLRIPFTVEGDPAGLSQLTLKVRYDDAFVAYINGVEIYRDGLTVEPQWNSMASASHEADGLDSFDVSDYIGQLRTGQNILALHGLNRGAASSDFIISGELIATKSSSSGQGVSVKYTGPFSLGGSALVKARTLSGETWSALNEAVFAVGPVAEKLRISEIMYHPMDADDPNDPNDPNEEYIELVNTGVETINLNLVSFTKGVDFTFGNIELGPGAYSLVVEDIDAFEARYGQGLPIAGQYTGNLANNGERVELVDAVGTLIHDFRYNDNWRTITDTDGYSITIIDPTNPDPNSWDWKDSWRASVYQGGSPGTDDSGILPNPGDIVISEVLAHSHDEASDWIELHNTTGNPVDIGGWYLSDSASNLRKYKVAGGTTIGAHEYKVFYENLHFGKNSVDPGVKEAFALSENGETVYVSSTIGDELTGCRESQDFGASATGISFGRYFKGSTGNYNFVPMSYAMAGESHAYPKVGPVVISEIMYNPSWPVGGSYTNDQYEYIEIKNISAVPVSLYRYDKSEPWKITDGVEFTFPDVPDIAVIGPGDYLVLARKPDAFMLRYPNVPSDKVLGPYGGSLDNAGERVQLSSPGDLNKFGERQYIREDRVVYSDGSHAEDQPGGVDLWPIEADGNGESLHRIDDSLYGNDPNNWQAGPPSPGQ